ncbi:Uncharacterized protein Adt_31290 [Abeliophyllum distichum]|uniref:Uncharacterized protein n=1 Tax=Abeliophyllum distichum TaxID=126358 RepID=A0ABD1RH90_9LAMI
MEKGRMRLDESCARLGQIAGLGAIPNVTRVDNTSSIVEQFRHFKPPSFDGKDDPFTAEEWLRKLEGIFEHLNCNNVQKVSFAEFMLVDNASHWWKSYSRAVTAGQQHNLS